MSKVALGIVHGPMMDSLFVRSLTRLLQARGDEIEAVIYTPGASGRLDNCRNLVSRGFLDTKAEWLMTLDTDMVFAVTDFDALRASADEKECPIICGMYFVNENPPRVAVATLRQNGSIKSIDDWDMDSLVDVDYAGAGFMLIHRSVFEKLGDEPYRQDIVAPSGALIGEDFSFCERARNAGFGIKVDPGVFIGHAKVRVLGYDL